MVYVSLKYSGITVGYPLSQSWSTYRGSYPMSHEGVQDGHDKVGPRNEGCHARNGCGGVRYRGAVPE